MYPLYSNGFFLTPVWAWAGYGHSENLKKSDGKKTDENEGTKIIVSRSHAGKVQEVAKKAFGEKTIVVPAGGAGKYEF